MRQAAEGRLGRRGRVRRGLAPRGVKGGQRGQLEDRWRYLLLAVDPRTGALRWRWRARCRQDHLTPVRAEWRPDAVGWDGAGAQRGKHLGERPTARGCLPPSSPERTPAERILEESRRRLEGRVYASRAAKQAEVEADLQELGADPARVRRLCGWAWVLAALRALPAEPAPGGRP